MNERHREGSGLAAGTSVSSWRVARMLAWRELIRFFRQRHRVMGALAQPLVFWLLFGAGLRQSFRMGPEGGPTFLEYYFPGTLMLTLLFTAIFATISLIEDRREGFLQAVLVAPVPRWSMVLGKLLGGVAIALIHGVVYLALGLTLHRSAAILEWLQLGGFMFLSALAMTGLGFIIAWRLDSTQGFHAVMNLLLMPMWLLSGAFFPIPEIAAETASGQAVLHWIMRLNPLTYCVAGVRRLWSGVDLPLGYYQPTLGVCWIVAILFAAGLTLAAIQVGRTRTVGDWQ